MRQREAFTKGHHQRIKLEMYKKNTGEFELGFMNFLVREALVFRQEKNIREHYGGLGSKRVKEAKSGHQL